VINIAVVLQFLAAVCTYEHFLYLLLLLLLLLQLMMLTDEVLREKYEPEFWKVAFSCKPEYVSSSGHEFKALSVNINNINTDDIFTTEPDSSSHGHVTGQCCSNYRPTSIPSPVLLKCCVASVVA